MGSNASGTGDKRMNVRSPQAICQAAFSLLRDMEASKLLLTEVYHPSRRRTVFTLGKPNKRVVWTEFVTPESVQTEVARFALQWPGLQEVRAHVWKVAKPPTFHSWRTWLEKGTD